MRSAPVAPGCGDMGEKKKKKARERGKPQYFLACFPARPIPLEPGSPGMASSSC